MQMLESYSSCTGNVDEEGRPCLKVIQPLLYSSTSSVPARNHLIFCFSFSCLPVNPEDAFTCAAQKITTRPCALCV